MKAGVKRKLGSPEPAHVKMTKREIRSHAGSTQELSPVKRISTSSTRSNRNTSSPRRHSPRFKNHGQDAERGHDTVQYSSSPDSSRFPPEADTELGLVITLDEDTVEEPERLRRKKEGKLKNETQTNTDKTMLSDGSSTQESSLDENSEEEFRQLDRDLAKKSKQHNLTSVHVRSIIHEVITNEHVVAMMKAAIRETQDMPMFEPKMTRSKLKEVVEKGVEIPNWNISPIKKPTELKPPQFVDIPLEDEEDSSDDEYYPDEDEEDETAEETILESDMDSIASSPRVSRRARSRTPVELSECDEEKSNTPQTKAKLLRHLRVEAAPMGPPAPPSQSLCSLRPQRGVDLFMEKLYAVDEELELSLPCLEPYQALNSGEDAERSLVACRTRSKRPLTDVPLDQLEAELKAPDITPDMYDYCSALEDKEWTHWLQGLMISNLDNEEEGDDDDDPEYNFLDDLDEPDLEDYRNDRAVRITKREVNELMDELFETFQDDTEANENDKDREGGQEREAEVESQSTAKFNVPRTIRFEEPLANMLTACRRTVREQLDALQQRREHQSRTNSDVPVPTMLLISPPSTLVVTSTQKRQLQQQIQQHVQLLTEVNMLCSGVERLQNQASATKLFLTELQSFADRADQVRAVVEPGFRSAFRVCNLHPSLDLLDELKKTQSPHASLPKCPRSRSVHRYPFLPAHLAWLFATRSVFLYPELLPHCSLDPSLQPPRNKNIYTKGEDGLIVLGLKHFSETEFPYHLMSQYLIQPKRVEQLRARVKDMSSNKAADNIIKSCCQQRTVPPLPVACCPVIPGEERPPVERDKNIMPIWLQKSLPYIHKALFESQSEESPSSHTLIFPERTPYPRCLPQGLTLQLHPSVKRPSCPRPPKPRPLHGFSRPASTPLAKAPVHLLPQVPAALPSQGLLLLTPSPFIPVSEAKVSAGPAHGTVPLNRVAPINFQYVVPQLGCVNPVEPPASLPPAVVHIASTPAVPCNTTVPTKDVPKKADVLRNQTGPRKLLPIQPSPLSPAQIIPSSSRPENLANAVPSVVVIQPPSILDTFVHPQIIKSSTSLPQNPFVQPSPPLQTIKSDVSASSHEGSSSLNAKTLENRTENLIPRSKSSVCSTVDLPADNSQFVLVQAAPQGGTPQFFLMPKTSQHTIKPEASHILIIPNTSDNLSLVRVGLPSEAVVSPIKPPPGTDRVEGELWKEEVDTGAEVDVEEMASALFGAPFLPEKSENFREENMDSSRCAEHIEELEKLEQINSPSSEEDHGSHIESTHPSANPNNIEEPKSSEDGRRTFPGLLSFASGSENQEQVGGGQGGGEDRKEQKEHQNESGGGKDRDISEGGEKRGGENGQGSAGGDRNDEEKDGDGEREDEEEEFDELTQDEDEEEVMSSASEESVLSVPELQETMEKLTWLASERRLCGEGDSEEENSPNSPASPTSPTSPISQNSQEENSDDEDDGPMKGEELETAEGEEEKLPEGDAPQEEDPPQASGKGAGRGRGRGRPTPRSLRKSRRQDRASKDTSKLLLLYDEHILENDPMRDSKDIAFAQAYLNRVRDVLQDTPGKMEEFLSLLFEFEQGAEGRSAVELFSQLKPLLKDWPDLLRDFSAFLLPEQALECGLFEDQQAFERSRRFLRQLEISFGENPSHYQKIVKALQTASALTPGGVDELKSQMATLLKGHTHLQGEFSVFFEELRPPPARPGQFEEAVWPDDGDKAPDGGDGVNLVGSGWLSGGFEEVTLPDLEEEEDTSKLPQMSGKSRKRKEHRTHRKYKDCNWPEMDCPCRCHFSSHDAKHRRHKRKTCRRCHGVKGTDGSKSLKSADRAFLTADPLPEREEEREESEKGGQDQEEEKEPESGVKEAGSGANSPHHEPEVQAWDVREEDPRADPDARDDGEEEDEDEEWKEGERGRRRSSPNKSNKEDEESEAGCPESSTPVQSGEKETAQPSQQSPSSETPVCAKNISLTPSGEKVVLWTREADRVILTSCQQQGANESTFQSVSEQLGNKTTTEVSKRFRDLMQLFHTSARQASSEDEANEQQSATDEEQD